MIVLAPPAYYHLPGPGAQFTYAIAEKYTYESKPSLNVTGSKTETYEASSFKGRPCLKKTTNKDIHARSKSAVTTSAYWISVSPSKIQSLAFAEGTALPVPEKFTGFNSHIPLKVGASWSDRGINAKGRSYAAFARVVAKERVSVPAGQFTCWVIRWDETYVGHNYRSAAVRTSWWSPTLAQEVKDELTETSPSKFYDNETVTVKAVFSLTSYRLGKHS